MTTDRATTNVMALLQRLHDIYGPPHADDDKAVARKYQEYINALSVFDPGVLRKAGDKALRTFKWWPKPSELVELCEASIPPPTPGDTEAHRLIKTRDDMVKQAARDYLLHCPSSLVDMALRQGWGRSLEDHARSVIRGCYDRDGKMPTEKMMMALRVPKEFADYYAQNGQAHLEFDHAEIIAKRQSNGAATSPHKQMDPAETAAVLERTLAAMKSGGRVIGEPPKPDWSRTQKGQFDAMQDGSPNAALHSKALTPTSRRIVGDRE